MMAGPCLRGALALLALAVVPTVEGLLVLAARHQGAARPCVSYTSKVCVRAAARMNQSLHLLSDANFVNLVIRERRKPVVVAFEMEDQLPLLAALHEKGQVAVYCASCDRCTRFLSWLNTNGIFITRLPAMVVFADGRPLGLLAGCDEAGGVRATWSGISRILVKHQLAPSGARVTSVRPALNGFDQHAYNFYTNVEKRYMRETISADWNP
ncbi:hypothetical protein AB1Y20_006867 [Prymnesium parvum]|uniref:Thioredoxin domain-containing protein n=1 Tax=Prymnesium parvum TaxID=97485 RepID=A0AB34J0Y0_PRYPA|mmetsp:Transcript_25943/g.39083  ORF Transcript_25943/g.39083 Transcript_25943/m.39083 type:complete len:211 (+) Transcript_25943:11-643(+)